MSPLVRRGTSALMQVLRVIFMLTLVVLPIPIAALFYRDRSPLRRAVAAQVLKQQG